MCPDDTDVVDLGTIFLEPLFFATYPLWTLSGKKKGNGKDEFGKHNYCFFIIFY